MTQQMTRGFTNRGFERVEFRDRYGAYCSLQKSSLATEDAIWFGVDKGWDEGKQEPRAVGTVLDGTFTPVGTRMHLTQRQVKDLLPFLQRFAETGELSE
jgi:hypothetical protein